MQNAIKGGRSRTPPPFYNYLLVPATTTQVENVIKALKGRQGTLVDLGSGDGRIVSFTNNEKLVEFLTKQFQNSR